MRAITTSVIQHLADIIPINRDRSSALRMRARTL